jgi:2-polyprenyl-3-methyl-5-hydroxy-6-metoxy-1,4-benzoquinol methylase
MKTVRSSCVVDADVGSGVGSRDAPLQYRRQLFSPWVSLFGDKAILDVGCRDLELMAETEAENYTGLDPSTAATALAKTTRPDWAFIAGDISAVGGRTFDLVLCASVLIQQPTRNDYDTLVTRLIDACRDTLIIDGYESLPTFTSGMTFYHEPLTSTLRRDPRIAYVKALGAYRDVEIILARRREAVPVNKWHIPIDNLVAGIHRSSRPKLLKSLVEFSLAELGFFSRTPHRMLEYPWIVSEMGEVGGLRVLEVGAGVNPLPLWLARAGAVVTTVDNHLHRRTQADQHEWNEWGFLDYSSLNERVRSFNCEISDLQTEDIFHIVYSTSVLEHVLASRRRSIFKRIAALLHPNGRLLMTLDLIPGTKQLWNRSEGREVESVTDHGDVDGVLAELENAGFTVGNCEIVRTMDGSRTDLALIKAARVRELAFGERFMSLIKRVFGRP